MFKAIKCSGYHLIITALIDTEAGRSVTVINQNNAEYSLIKMIRLGHDLTFHPPG